MQVKTICNNFVTDANGSEAIQVGINSVRELFVRCPPVLSEEGMEPLVRDLVMYRKYKGDKGVNMTARGLMNTVRELHPKLLRRKDRGRGNGEREEEKRGKKVLVLSCGSNRWRAHHTTGIWSRTPELCGEGAAAIARGECIDSPLVLCD